ncbi:MAG: hypothetical protein JW991_04725 [Candidatus Pacebacteria bacterium]|nr:hypothetical protein [Candidatus Paceibacterota bacterium]
MARPESYNLLLARYARDLNASPEALRSPTWLGRIAEYVIAVEQSPEQTLTVQLADGFGLLTRSLAFSSRADVNVFERLHRSAAHFSMGYNRKDPVGPRTFREHVRVWLDQGVRAETIAGWFQSLAGLAFLDPVLVPGLFLRGGEIKPLEGFRSGPSSLADSAYHDLSDRGEVWGSEEFRRIEALEQIGRDVSWHSPWNGVAQLEHFSTACAQELGREEGSRKQDFVLIAQAAAKASETFGIFLESSSEVGALRSTSVADIIPLIALALGERLDRGGENNLAVTDRAMLAQEMCSLVRRRLLALSRESLLGLCASFTPSELLVPKFSPGRGVESFAGWGFKKLNSHVRGVDGELSGFTHSLIGQFILEMRLRGLHTFEWSEAYYRFLGMDNSVWRKHNRQIDDHEIRTKRPRSVGTVRNGVSVLDFHGQFGPIHVGHEEAAREVAGRQFPSLFGGGAVYVGISVNRGNPEKRHLERKAAIRREMVHQATRGQAGIFLYSARDAGRPTADKLLAHCQAFKDRGLTVSLGRLTGTDALDRARGIYTEETEPQGHEFLNGIRTVLNLQMGELGTAYQAIPVMGRVFDNGVQAVFLMGSLSDVHSSFIRQRLHDLDDETLATLTHPRNVELTRELWG